jgi:type IV secretion system protein VirB1
MVDLLPLITRCAPGVNPATMAAIVRVESSGNPFAINDNTTGHRYFPTSRAEATMILTRLVAAGHQVDAGLAQIDSENFVHYGLTTSTVFSVCQNIKAGAAIFQAGYRMAVQAGYGGQQATFRAFEAYNSGRLTGDAHYADAVLRSAGLLVGGPLGWIAVCDGVESPRCQAGPGRSLDQPGHPVCRRVVREMTTIRRSIRQPGWSRLKSRRFHCHCASSY